MWYYWYISFFFFQPLFFFYTFTSFILFLSSNFISNGTNTIIITMNKFPFHFWFPFKSSHLLSTITLPRFRFFPTLPPSHSRSKKLLHDFMKNWRVDGNGTPLPGPQKLNDPHILRARLLNHRGPPFFGFSMLDHFYLLLFRFRIHLTLYNQLVSLFESCHLPAFA